MTRTALSLAAVLLSTLAVACGGSSDASTAGDDAITATHGTATTVSHASAFAACNAAATAALTKAVSTLDITQVIDTQATCIQAANDAEITTIDAALTAAHSSLAGSTKSTFAAYRTAAAAMCGALANGSPDYGGSIIADINTQCALDNETTLANLVGGYAVLGTEKQVQVPRDAKDFPACYAAFDASSLGSSDFATLSNCIHAVYSAKLPDLAANAVTNGANAGADAPTVQKAIDAKLNAVAIDADDSLCEIFAEESSTGSSGAKHDLLKGACEADAVSAVGAEVLAYDQGAGGQ